MIDLSYNYNKPEPNVHQQVAEALVEAFHNSGLEAASVAVASDAERCCLQSPILRLVKERNEARELVKRVLLASESSDKEYYEAMLAAHRAVLMWKGGAQ